MNKDNKKVPKIPYTKLVDFEWKVEQDRKITNKFARLILMPMIVMLN
jgi:hypothetical protein